MDAQILNRQRDAMATYDLDALVAFSMENVRYGAGYVVQSQELRINNRQFAVVATRDGQSAFLLTSNEATEARERSSITELYPYDEFASDPMAVLYVILEELGVAEARLGIDFAGVSAQRWRSLETKLTGAHLVDAKAAFSHARSIKTDAEVELLRDAARIADDAQARAHELVVPGMTEREIYRIIADEAIGLGADRVVMIQVAAGERSMYSNPVPSDRQVQDGEIVKIDTFVSRGGYLSDTGRSIAVGRAPAVFTQAWAHQHETMVQIHEAIKPGVDVATLWELFVDSFARNGHTPCIGFLGHGLGLSLHEEPFIAPDSKGVLAEGMVFAVEPILEINGVGLHYEHNLLVSDGGVVNLTPRFGPNLIEV